jgi:hypothetical protein
MAILTESLGYNKGSAAPRAEGLHKVTRYEVELDFAAISAARTAAGAAAIGAGDGVEAIRIPAKSLVMAVGMDVVTAEGGTLTVDIGDGTDADGWLDGVNANTVASYCSAAALAEGTPNTFVGYGAGKYYSAADTIDVITVNAADAAVVRVWALVADCA